MTASVVAFPARDLGTAMRCEFAAHNARRRVARVEQADRIREQFTAEAHRVADELARLDPRQLRERASILAGSTVPPSVERLHGAATGASMGRQGQRAPVGSQIPAAPSFDGCRR